MSVLNGVEIDFEEREQYLGISLDKRIKFADSVKNDKQLEFVDSKYGISAEKVAKYALAEQFIFTATENGFGKRTSAYEYRVTNRGGKGIVNIVTSKRNGDVVSSFPIDFDDQIMLITDRGTMIRCPIKDVRIAGRSTQGVTIFRKSDNEKIVSIALIPLSEEEDSDVPEEANA